MAGKFKEDAMNIIFEYFYKVFWFKKTEVEGVLTSKFLLLEMANKYFVIIKKATREI